MYAAVDMYILIYGCLCTKYSTSLIYLQLDNNAVLSSAKLNFPSAIK